MRHARARRLVTLQRRATPAQPVQKVIPKPHGVRRWRATAFAHRRCTTAPPGAFHATRRTRSALAAAQPQMSAAATACGAVQTAAKGRGARTFLCDASLETLLLRCCMTDSSCWLAQHGAQLARARWLASRGNTTPVRSPRSASEGLVSTPRQRAGHHLGQHSSLASGTHPGTRHSDPS